MYHLNYLFAYASLASRDHCGMVKWLVDGEKGTGRLASLSPRVWAFWGDPDRA